MKLHLLLAFVTVPLVAGCSRSTNEKQAGNPALPEAPRSTSTPSRPKIPNPPRTTISAEVKRQIEKILPAGYRFYKAPMPANVYLIESLTTMDTSQDPWVFGTGNRSGSDHEKPYIAIYVYPRVDPANIGDLRKKAETLRAKLPPQKSKSHLSEWHRLNKATLDLINAVPTFYDAHNSYKLRYSYAPEEPAQRRLFKQLLAKVEGLFTAYPQK